MIPPSPPPPSPKSATKPSPPPISSAAPFFTAMAEAVHPDTFHIPFPQIWDSLEGPFSIPVAALNTRACRYGNPRDMLSSQQTGPCGIR